MYFDPINENLFGEPIGVWVVVGLMWFGGIVLFHGLPEPMTRSYWRLQRQLKRNRRTQIWVPPATDRSGQPERASERAQLGVPVPPMSDEDFTRQFREVEKELAEMRRRVAALGRPEDTIE